MASEPSALYMNARRHLAGVHQAADLQRALQAERDLGLYILKTDGVKAFGYMASTIREVMLGMPGKISHSLTPHSEQDRIAIHDIVDHEVRECLATLGDADTYAGYFTSGIVLESDIAPSAKSEPVDDDGEDIA